jgi:hypothetical protein
MADASDVRHDTIVVPERMSPAQVRALEVRDEDMVAFFASRRITAGQRRLWQRGRVALQLPGDTASL